MDDKIQNRIDGYFEKLTEFINKIPLSDKGKNYIWMHSYCQFYDEPVPSENGKNTYGIQTEWQLQRFIEQFKKNFQKLRIKRFEAYSKELENLLPSEAVAKIDKQLYELRKKELLAEIGGEGLNDWENWLKKYYSNEIDLHQKRPARKPPQQQKKTSYVWQNNPDTELPMLHSLMINKYKLIASETTYEQFKAIFTGQPIDSIEPIKWIDTNRLLAYFLDSAFSGQQWQSIAGNGKLFKNNHKVITANDLSVAKKGYIDFGLPKGYQIIEMILKTIKKHS
jgi:hypothetical protein